MSEGLGMITEQMLGWKLKEIIKNGTSLNVYKTNSVIAGGSSSVRFIGGGITSFSTKYDMLLAFNKGVLISPSTYTVSSNSITLNSGTFASGNLIDFIQIKNGSLETALVGKTNIYTKEINLTSNQSQFNFVPDEVDAYNSVTDTFLVFCNTAVLHEGEHFTISDDQKNLIAVLDEYDNGWYAGSNILIYYFRGINLDPGMITKDTIGSGCSLTFSGTGLNGTYSNIPFVTEWNDSNMYANNAITAPYKGRYKLDLTFDSSVNSTFECTVNNVLKYGLKERIKVDSSYIVELNKGDVMQFKLITPSGTTLNMHIFVSLIKLQ